MRPRPAGRGGAAPRADHRPRLCLDDLLADATVGFVDVPGHSSGSSRTCSPGWTAWTHALFVVAADEGGCRSRTEHLAVLDLIGVNRAVVALTRVDLVRTTPTEPELAAAEVADRARRNHARRSRDRGGVGPLPASVWIDLRDAPRRRLVGASIDRGLRPRLWIDRSFTIGGAGTVVTGTLIGRFDSRRRNAAGFPRWGPSARCAACRPTSKSLRTPCRAVGSRSI